MSSIQEAGDIISNYRLVRLIGSGGFGEVWLAEHIDLASRVAIKIPTMAEYVRQLRAESRIQYDIEHPNIVRILDLNTAHNPPYCVMDLVEGENLRARLEREKTIPRETALDIIRQILLALHEAHRRGIVHRDLKPENILIDDRQRVKITDFGLGLVGGEVTRSILLSSATGPREAAPGTDGGSSESNAPLSAQRSDSMGAPANHGVVGTYDYMSPEQKSGINVDASSDIYSAGVILFEMLTGARPEANPDAELERCGEDAVISDAILSALDEYDFRCKSAAQFLRNLRLNPVAPARGTRGHGGSGAVDDYLASLEPRFKLFTGDAFRLGSDDGPENERPCHPVRVESFLLGIHAVTAAE